MLNMLPKFELVPISRYFMTLAKARRAFHHTFVEHVQAPLAQDDVGCVLGHVRRVDHRDAHVGRVQRRRVVDAVAEKADHVAAQLQRRHHAVLLRRQHAREDRVPFGECGERGFAERVGLAAEHDHARIQPDRLADATRDALVVAGEDLHRDAVAAQRLQRAGNAGRRRIGEAQKAGSTRSCSSSTP
jgi:hypothetical protein